ncbi:Protein GrpE [compost metagenome]
MSRPTESSPSYDLDLELSKLLQFTRGDLYIYLLFDFNYLLRCLKKSVASHNVNGRWLREIEKLRTLMNTKMQQLQYELLKGEIKVEKTLYDVFRDDLLNFREIDIDQLTQDLPSPETSNLTEVREQITKGNRANFKMIQEVIGKVEHLSAELSLTRQEQFKEEIGQLNQTISLMTQSLIEMFDLLDLIRATAEQQEDVVWKQNVEHVVRQALNMLATHGIEEINVNNQLFNGLYMEGIGTVSPQEIKRELPRYTVFEVTQRGFTFKETGELIRRAKVITVY